MNKKLLFSVIIITALSFSASVAAKPAKYKWRIAESWPKDFPIFGNAISQFGKLVNELSEGEIQITSVPANEHGRGLEVLQMVRDGDFEMGHTGSFFYTNIDINSVFFSSLPFGLIASEKYGWFYHGGGLELMQKVYAKHGVIAYPGGNTANQMGGWFRKEIKSLEDLKGLKMRIPGMAGDIVKRLGVQSVNLPPSDLYNSLETDQIDAVEWVGPSLDIGMGFHKIAPYYYTGWHEPSSELIFFINDDAFNSLPQRLQNIVTHAMRLTAYDLYTDIFHTSAHNLQKMRAEFPDIKIRAFPNDVMRALAKETQAMIDEMAEKDPMSKEIIESLRRYKDKSRVWTRISDQAYLNNTAF